jgi:chromosomal replication initiation ATPase DnaA
MGLSAELHRIMKLEFLYLKTFCIEMALKFQKKLWICSTQHQIECSWIRGAIISLMHKSSFNKITIELAKVCRKFVKNVKREISIDYIQKTVSDYFQLDLEILQSKTRKKDM